MTILATRRLVAALLPLAIFAAPISAQAEAVFFPPPPDVVSSGPPLTGQRADIARQLPRYGYYNVDVRRLSRGQVAQISHLIYSGRSEGDIRGLIGASLRRNNVLQRIADTATNR